MGYRQWGTHYYNLQTQSSLGNIDRVGVEFKITCEHRTRLQGNQKRVGIGYIIQTGLGNSCRPKALTWNICKIMERLSNELEKTGMLASAE